jgi:hypothetical protein
LWRSSTSNHKKAQERRHKRHKKEAPQKGAREKTQEGERSRFGRLVEPAFASMVSAFAPFVRFVPLVKNERNDSSAILIN